MEFIQWNIIDNIGRVTLANAPRNEMNHPFFNTFNKIIDNAIAHKTLKGIIIYSIGRHFSSGANIDELLSLFKNEDAIPKAISDNKKAFLQITELEMPVVACISGICYGSAMELALCAHFRIATENALLSLPETSFEIIPGLGGIYNTQKLIGTAKTMEWVLSTESFSGTNAHALGLVDHLADKKEQLHIATQIIEQASNNYKKAYKKKYLGQLADYHA